jgi:hypothetical protein
MNVLLQELFNNNFIDNYILLSGIETSEKMKKISINMDSSNLCTIRRLHLFGEE